MTALDSNILVAFWNPDDSLNSMAREALETAASRGGLVICGAVYGELLAGPGRSGEFVDKFLDDTNIAVDWSSSETVWRAAGMAFQKYATRRRRQKRHQPRRILTDFYIGAHALSSGNSLLTLDDRIYKTAFPDLTIVRV